MTEYIILSEEEIQQLLAGEEIPHEANTRNYIICSRACFRKNNPGIAKALFDKDVTTVQVEKCKNCKYFDYDDSFCTNRLYYYACSTYCISNGSKNTT